MAVGVNQKFIKTRVSTKVRGQGIGWAVFIDAEVSDNDSRSNDADLMMSEGRMHMRVDE